MKHFTHSGRFKLFMRTAYLFCILSSGFIFCSKSPAQTGWYEQTLPVSGTISDMQFIDSQTGWITLYSPFNFIKTTNGGKNWEILYSGTRQFGSIDFLNDSLGYAIGSDNMFNGMISKTTNGGINWTAVYTGVRRYTALDLINQDTGWFGAFLGDDVQIIRTTNGGQTLELQYSYASAGQGINEVFFVDKPFDGYFYGWFINNGLMSKTTNSGFNWSTPTNIINGETGDFISLFFLNSDTGWVSFRRGTDYRIYLTKSSGNNWFQQFRDSVGIYDPTFIESIGFGLVWAGNGFWNIVHASTTGGEIWGKQSTPIFRPIIIEVLDSLNGWIGYNRLAHTTDGGGLITYAGIDPGSTEIPVNFILEQNYPNPFNPQTTIKFSVSNPSSVSLMIYDIAGKEILKIYDNETLIPGNYKIALDFSRRSLSSGTYFYSMKVNDKNSGLLYNETKKMIYLK